MNFDGAAFRSRLEGLKPDEEQALDELLEANGLSRQQLPAVVDQVTHLEMFLHQYPRMFGVQFFPFLKSLALLNQDIKEIEFLEDCVQLEKLFLIENLIKKIKGLETLRGLKELHLYSNRIAKIEGIQTLERLEVLWLADNSISCIEGLERLVRLRDLNLARNDITCIGDSLAANTALQVLNLSDNAIGSFKEIRSLSCLPQLVDLCFADPMWGDCPLSGLCNYQTYVLFVLPRLTSLDTLLLADETKALAEATFLKKQMYYNMRIKTMHRNARNVIRLAAECKKSALQLRQGVINKLQLHQRNIQRELSEAEHYCGTEGGTDGGRLDAAARAALEQQLQEISARLTKYNQQRAQANEHFEQCTNRTYQLMDQCVTRMMLELDTAGNIRLEEGRPTDLWYTSCADLFNSRFNPIDYEPLGISGVTVMGVTRVHNRWLRNCFEKRLAQCVDTSDTAYKRSLEYLFVGEHPLLPGEFERVVEHGFKAPAALAAMGLDGAVLLSNNVFLAESLRLAVDLEQRAAAASGSGGGAAGGSGGGAGGTVATGQIMVVKAYLGRTASDSTSIGTRTAQQKLLGKDGGLAAASLLEGPRILKSNFLDADSVYRTKAGDTKQRMWYVLDNVLVLPEYIIDFQYELVPGGRMHMAHRQAAGSSSSSSGGAVAAAARGVTAAGGVAQVQLSPASAQAVLETLDPDIRPLARPLLPWLACHLPAAKAGPPGGPATSSPAAAWAAEEAEVNALLSTGRPTPAPEPRPKLYLISDETISAHVAAAAASSSPGGMGGASPPPPALHALTYLNLHDCALRKIENLSTLRSLRTLILTFNEIQRIEGVSDLASLQRLDLGHNLIRRIEGIKGLGALTRLDLSSNQISKLEEVYAIKKYVPQLSYLDLSDNPLCDDKSYRPTVLRKMRSLTTFDQMEVTAEEREAFSDTAGGVTVAMVAAAGVVGGRWSSADASPPPAPSTSSASSPDLRHIVELNLDRRHIRRLQHLTGLQSLRSASFLDNQISHIEGLEACTALEELCLEDNRLTQVEGLQGLGRLRKLLLGRNKIAALELMSHVTNLTQLSIEDNEIASLAGIEPLTQLMELYAANNRLMELKEVQRLRELPKLIILDLSGNPLTGALASSSSAPSSSIAASSSSPLQQPTNGTASAAAAAAALAAAASDDYRLYTIYNVRKLKVLDGTPIEAAEQAAAKSKYSGRLTRDFLEERFKHTLFDRMRDMDCSGLKIRDVGTVFLAEEFEFLQELSLDNNVLVEVSGLALLRQLQVLKLNNNRLGEECTFKLFRMIDRNPDLYRIITAQVGAHGQQDGGSGGFLGATALIHGMELFPCLQVLQLGGNQIASISSLQLGGLSGLRSLFLQNNDITRIDGLGGLVNLQELVLDRNRIRVIDPDAFVDLPRLRELRLEENGLRSLAHLQHLTSLQALHLGYNRIAEAADLDRLEGLYNLVEITLVNNPVTRKQTYRAVLINRCPSLCVADGQPISPEEREYSEALFAPQPTPAELAAAAAQQQGVQGGKGGPGGGLRMACVDFSGLAVGLPHGSQGSVPSIQSNTLIMAGPAAFGLEGLGLRELPPDLAGAMAARMIALDPRGRPISNAAGGKGGPAGVGGGGGGSARAGAAGGAKGGAGGAGVTAPPGVSGAGLSASPSRRQALMGRPYGGRGY